MESGSDDEDDDDDDLPEELRGTLSPTQLETQQVPRRNNGDKNKTDTNGRKPKSSAKGGRGGGTSQMSILDLLQHIVNEPAPKLPRDDGRFKPEMCDFVDLCLRKDPKARPSPKELTKHEYVKDMESAKVDLLGWVKTLKV
jgi:mitogen-activated protein kinase kinase